MARLSRSSFNLFVGILIGIFLSNTFHLYQEINLSTHEELRGLLRNGAEWLTVQTPTRKDDGESLSAVKNSIFCNHSLSCSLNGCYVDGKGCQCHKPWSGDSCSVLITTPSPPSAKSLFPSPERKNSWSGPVCQDDADGRFHMYLPIYAKGNLAKSSALYHGVADQVGGPYNWTDLGVNPGPNPGLVNYFHPRTGQAQHALFAGGHIWLEDKLKGGHFNYSIGDYPHANFSPLFHNGSFYGVFQATTFVYRNEDIRNRSGWERHGSIVAPHQGQFKRKSLEDPHLWVDEYGFFHVIAHAFHKRERHNCSNSLVSAHLFSVDGRQWHRSSEAPYGHEIQYDDGTSQSYSTLERPYLVLDKRKRPTHIILAASLEHGDQGCAHTEHCAKNERFCSCVNCKWIGLAGTVVLSLDTS